MRAEPSNSQTCTSLAAEQKPATKSGQKKQLNEKLQGLKIEPSLSVVDSTKQAQTISASKSPPSPQNAKNLSVPHIHSCGKTEQILAHKKLREKLVPSNASAANYDKERNKNRAQSHERQYVYNTNKDTEDEQSNFNKTSSLQYSKAQQRLLTTQNVSKYERYLSGEGRKYPEGEGKHPEGEGGKGLAYHGDSWSPCDPDGDSCSCKRVSCETCFLNACQVNKCQLI